MKSIRKRAALRIKEGGCLRENSLLLLGVRGPALGGPGLRGTLRRIVGKCYRRMNEL